MAVSFVTRFRRHLAILPFFLIFLVPAGVVVFMLVDRRADAPDIEMSGEMVCIEAEQAVGTMADPCPDPELSISE